MWVLQWQAGPVVQCLWSRSAAPAAGAAELGREAQVTGCWLWRGLALVGACLRAQQTYSVMFDAWQVESELGWHGEHACDAHRC